MAKPPKKYSNLDKRQISFIKKKLGIKKIQDIDTTILKKFKEELKNLKDNRNKNMIIFKQWDVIMCVLLASFAHNNTWEEIHEFVSDNYKWLKKFLQMTGGIPTVESYERIISLIDTEELNTLLLDFFNTLVLQLNPIVELMNFDGRVNNGSKRKATIMNSEIKPLNCLNCYSNKYGYCIETISIDEKTNEIPTIKELINGMNLSGVIATWDELNSQTENIKAVIESGGDYIVPIKGNQGNFYKDLDDYFDEEKCDSIIAGNTESNYLKVIEKSHSSIIEYEYFQTSDVDWYFKLNEWKGIKTFGLVRKTITKKVLTKNERKNAKRKTTEKTITVTENRYYISSKQVNIKEFSVATRQHWSIENKVHWHLDFTFSQDDNTTFNKKALLNLEIIHKFILAVLERVKVMYNKSLKSIRKHLSNNFEEFFPEFLCYLLLN